MQSRQRKCLRGSVHRTGKGREDRGHRRAILSGKLGCWPQLGHREVTVSSLGAPWPQPGLSKIRGWWGIRSPHRNPGRCGGESPMRSQCVCQGLEVAEQPGRWAPRGPGDRWPRCWERQSWHRPVFRARKQEATTHRDLVIWGTPGTMGCSSRWQQDTTRGSKICHPWVISSPGHLETRQAHSQGLRGRLSPPSAPGPCWEGAGEMTPWWREETAFELTLDLPKWGWVNVKVQRLKEQNNLPLIGNFYFSWPSRGMETPASQTRDRPPLASFSHTPVLCTFRCPLLDFLTRWVLYTGPLSSEPHWVKLKAVNAFRLIQCLLLIKLFLL